MLKHWERKLPIGPSGPSHWLELESELPHVVAFEPMWVVVGSDSWCGLGGVVTFVDVVAAGQLEPIGVDSGSA